VNAGSVHYNSGKFPEVVMRQFVVGLFFVFMLAGALRAFAQTSPARVCVAEVETREPSISPAAVRDALIRFLSKQKGLEAEEVPLDASDSAAVMTQAKDKKCDRVVDTTVTEVHSESGYTGGYSGVNLQTFFVTVNYRLSKVSDGAEQASGSLKASDRGSAQSAVIATMKKTAEKVAEAIKNGAR
jgi:hypothetical protein